MCACPGYQVVGYSAEDSRDQEPQLSHVQLMWLVSLLCCKWHTGHGECVELADSLKESVLLYYVANYLNVYTGKIHE
jgi:hypothetical protein